MSDKITPVLWFDKNGEEAANFYVSLLPDSRIDRVTRAPAEYPSGSEGDVITVDFTLAGRQYQVLNGGPNFTFNEAVSFMIHCRDQEEVDRLWEALAADGGQPVHRPPCHRAHRSHRRDLSGRGSAPARPRRGHVRWKRVWWAGGAG